MANKLKLKDLKSKKINSKVIKLEFELEKYESESLGQLGISTSLEKKDFSFGQVAIDSESLVNPNILEKGRLNKITNSPNLLKDKFDELSDPIFDLDENRPEVSMEQKNVDNQGITKTADRIRISKLGTKYKK